MNNPVKDMQAIEGAISDLAALSDRPQGYPFSKVTVYSVDGGMAAFMPELCHARASDLPEMKRLDFKKAGKVFGSKVQEMKNDLDNVPDEYLIVAKQFDVVDEFTRKTTACRKYMVEVERDDMDDLWVAIQFRKAVKQYITEALGWNIVAPIFGGDSDKPIVTRVYVTLGNCKEALYQSLERYGEQEFAHYPISLNIPSRRYIADNLDIFTHKAGGATLKIESMHKGL